MRPVEAYVQARSHFELPRQAHLRVQDLPAPLCFSLFTYGGCCETVLRVWSSDEWIASTKSGQQERVSLQENLKTKYRGPQPQEPKLVTPVHPYQACRDRRTAPCRLLRGPREILQQVGCTWDCKLGSASADWGFLRFSGFKSLHPETNKP